jgi:predicted anti-sigma-YlaC factor YlaD
MNCPECEDLLQRRLDGEAVDPSALEQHLAVCAACREQHYAAQLLLDALRTKPCVRLPDHLAASVVRAVVEDRIGRRRVHRWWTGVAAAASLLVVALAGYVWFAPEKQEPVPGPFVKGDNTTESPSLDRTMEEARAAVSNLTEKIADGTKKQARLLLTAANPMEFNVSLPAPRPLEVPAEAARSFRQTTQGVGDGLQTVARSAQRAVNFLAREVAALEPSMRN